MIHFLRYLVQTVVLLPLKIFFIIFVNVRAKGRINLKNIDTSSGVIFAANHKSQLDIFLLPVALPIASRFLPMYYIAFGPRHYRNIPWAKYIYGGSFFRFFGGITFKRGLHNYAKSLAEHEELLREGKSLCVFPEGKRIFSERLGKAHGGVAYLASATGATIIPVHIISGYNIKPLEFFTFGYDTKVVFGEPTTYMELYDEIQKEGTELIDEVGTHKLVAQKVMDRIQNLT